MYDVLKHMHIHECGCGQEACLQRCQYHPSLPIFIQGKVLMFAGMHVRLAGLQASESFPVD